MAKVVQYLTISYPNFSLGSIIDPEEANQNNYELVTKINEFVDHLQDALDVSENASDDASNAVDISNEAMGNSTEALSTANTALENSEEALGQDEEEPYTGALGSMRISAELRQDWDELAPELREARDQAVHASTGGLDDRYVTRSESDLENNIDILYEVYYIVNPDNGDGTFTYKDSDDNEYIGDLSGDYQVFDLKKGDYTVGHNRISAYINDTLHRSKASGGLYEFDSNRVGIVSENEGTEITIKYMTISGSLGAGIVIGFVEPPNKYVGKVWIDTGGDE